jgi:pyruvate dehydrogenase E2 component (dihydrolipoamide acetyltransferase)
VELVMPKLGLTMTEGTVVRWLKRSGEPVRRGEIVAEVETEKITYPLEAPVEGVLEIVVGEGETVPVQAVLATVRGEGEGPPQRAEPEAPGAEGGEPTRSPLSAAGTRPASRVQASPAARRLARTLGVDLAAVTGSGPNGLITTADVEKAASQRSQGTAAEPLSPTRRTIARRMVESLQNSAQLTLTRTLDARALARLQREIEAEVEARHGFRPTVTDFVLLAVGSVLARHPELRVVLEGDNVRRLPSVDVGVAVDVAGGLLVPVLRAVDRKTLVPVGQELRRLAEEARSGRLRPEDVGGAALTVSNLGMFGVDSFTPILNPPEPMLLGVGRLMAAPLVDAEGGIVAGHILTLSLTIDHRLIDGAPGARFLADVVDLLEHPKRLPVQQ